MDKKKKERKSKAVKKIAASKRCSLGTASSIYDMLSRKNQKKYE